MKKIILSILLLLIVSFLSGCSIDWNNEKNQKIVKLEKQVEELKKEKENDLFKKKQECISYYDKMSNILKIKYPEYDGLYVKFEILESIYSKEKKLVILFIKHLIDYVV